MKTKLKKGKGRKGEVKSDLISRREEGGSWAVADLEETDLGRDD